MTARRYEEDLALANACLNGDSEALTTFARDVLPVVGRCARALGAGADLVEDLAQELHQACIVGRDEHPPLLSRFRGEGSLASWLGVIARRHCMRRLRGSLQEVDSDDDVLYGVLIDESDPELAMLRADLRREMRRAFREAVKALPRRERAALRLNALDGLSIDHIARMYGVHRATAARWIVRARDSLSAQARQALRLRLGIADDEVESMVRALGSHIDISIASAFVGVSRGT